MEKQKNTHSVKGLHGVEFLFFKINKTECQYREKLCGHSDDVQVHEAMPWFITRLIPVFFLAFLRFLFQKCNISIGFFFFLLQPWTSSVYGDARCSCGCGVCMHGRYELIHGIKVLLGYRTIYFLIHYIRSFLSFLAAHNSNLWHKKCCRSEQSMQRIIRNLAAHTLRMYTFCKQSFSSLSFANEKNGSIQYNVCVCVLERRIFIEHRAHGIDKLCSHKVFY